MKGKNMKNLKQLFIKAVKESEKVCEAENLRAILILEWYGNEALFSIEYADPETKEYVSKEILVGLKEYED